MSKRFVMLFLVLLALVACQQEEELTFPTVKLLNGTQTIELQAGNYRWTVQQGAESRTETTDVASPNERLSIEEAHSFSLNEQTAIQFSQQPTHYEVHVWDAERIVASYPTIEEIQEQGTYVIEVVGYWNETNYMSYTATIHLQ